jgi:hypothetical protein
LHDHPRTMRRRQERLILKELSTALPRCAERLHRAAHRVLSSGIFWPRPLHTSTTAPVTISVTAKDDTVVLTVAGCGPGLQLEEADLVFDRFYRIAPDRGRDWGGSGLGMLDRPHGDRGPRRTVCLVTAPGEGLTVEVRLPAIANS